VKIGIRGKLFLISISLVALAVFAIDTYLSSVMDSFLTARLRDDLFVRAALVEREAARAELALDDLAGWDALADDLGARARARVTLIRADGAVLGDSEVAAADLPGVENHGARPEVRDALAGRRGWIDRYSTTVHSRMSYVAVPLRRDGKVAGAARLATPLAEVGATTGRVRRYLRIGSLIGLAVPALLALFGAHRLGQIMRALTGAARRMASGDLSVRTRVRGRDELAELSRALDNLADSLAGSLKDLRAERDLSSGILTAMHEGVLVVDLSGRIALVNPALREMLLLGGDVVGRSPLEAIRHAELPAILDRARENQGPATGEIEVAGVKPRRLLVHASRIPGAPGGLLVVFVDVTDVRRLESLRRDFVANVSHELRTPVTAVRSAAETLRGAAARDPAAAERFLDIIERNAERLQRLVEDLLDLSRIESREYKLHVEPIGLAPVVGHVLTLARDRAEAKRIELRAGDAGAAAVRADRRALEQVLANLIDNAVKYCPDGSTVEVDAETVDMAVRVTVSDDGPGIEAKHLPRLFERFYRVDAGRSRDLGGTGLGLSIVKHLVEAMGGRVAVDSAPGKGTRFTFTLPRA
jgi:two-component system phosphate regulon sensor histidine kinase PhoR